MDACVPKLMIGWLKGEKVDIWKQGSREGIVLNCGGIGYEVQLLPRQLRLAEEKIEIILWIHQVQREDGCNLFGFSEQLERDLFRVLLGVNGVGAQIAMALLQEGKVDDVVNAIINEDLSILTRAQGVGKRIAERITVELRNKLSAFSQTTLQKTSLQNECIEGIPLQPSKLSEIQDTLKSIGYEEVEVHRALIAVAESFRSGAMEHSKIPIETEQCDIWLKASLQWLSREAA